MADYIIRLRFVHGTAISSDLIEYREGVCLPFTPSHVECVRDDGKYVGQHGDGGMQARNPGYDQCKPEDEFFVDLPATFKQYKDFYNGVDASIGEPYDWAAILGFALDGHHHSKFHAICSAKMFLMLRKADWFPSHAPVAVPAHCIDPRDLLLMVSCVTPINFDRKATP